MISNERGRQIAEALQDIKRRQFVIAEARLRPLVEVEPEDGGALDFCNPLEEMWLRHTSPRREIKRSTVRYFEAYQLYAYVLVEWGQLSEACRMLERAGLRNPVALGPHYERLDIARRVKALDEYRTLAAACFDRAYTPTDLARCYRNFAWEFAEREQWHAALACLVRSRHWQDDILAAKELMYIQMRTGKTVSTFHEADNRAILEAAGVPVEPRSIWHEVAVDLGRHFQQSGLSDLAAQCFKVAGALNLAPWVESELARCG